MNVNRKISASYFAPFCHFSRILNRSREFWKYASFEGSKINGKV